MTVVVLSIPYTGTRWTLKLLRGWGLVDGVTQQAAHITKPGWRELMAAADKVVVPLRDRASVDMSATSRGQRVSTDAEWDMLFGLGALGNVHYLPIPPTEDGVRALANFLAVQVGPVDWTPEGDL